MKPKVIKIQKYLLIIIKNFLSFLKILFSILVSWENKKVSPGPVVTLYEFEPAAGIKTSKIVNLTDDIARSTSSISTRIAPVPGKIQLVLKSQTKR